MSLSEALDALREKSRTKFSPDVIATINRAQHELRSSGIVERALKVGDVAPSFSAPNQDGQLGDSWVLLRHGPLVLTFYRGVW